MTTAANIHSTRRRTPHANSTSIASKALSVLLSVVLAIGFTPIPAISAPAEPQDVSVSAALERTSCHVIVKLTGEQREKLAESGELPSALPQGKVIASSSDMYLLEYASSEEAAAEASALTGEFEYAECDFEMTAADDIIAFDDAISPDDGAFSDDAIPSNPDDGTFSDDAHPANPGDSEPSDDALPANPENAAPENEAFENAPGAEEGSAGDLAQPTQNSPEGEADKEAFPSEAEKQHKIALIDSGRPVKGDFADALSVIGGKVFDDCGHATETAEAIRELASDSEIVSIKALDGKGKGSAYYTCAAIYSALDAEADIIVLPLYAKASHDSKSLSGAISSARRAGAIVVASAGNDGEDAANYVPANIEEAISVGAAATDGQRLETSNYGDDIDIWAVSESTSIAAAKAAGWLAANSDLEDPLADLSSQDGKGLFFKQVAEASGQQPAQTEAGDGTPAAFEDDPGGQQTPIAVADADSTCVIAKAADDNAKEMLEQQPVLMEFDDVYILEYASAEQAEEAAADLERKCVFAEVDRPVEATSIVADSPAAPGEPSSAEEPLSSMFADADAPAFAQGQAQDGADYIEGQKAVWDTEDYGEEAEEEISDEPWESDFDDGADEAAGNAIATEAPVFASDNGAAARIALLDSGAPATGNIVEALTMLDGTADDTSRHAAGVLEAIERYAPEAEIVSIKVLDRDNRGTVSAVYAGIMSAISADVDIINLSLVARATEESRAIEDAVRCALDAGIIVVASAGNNASDASVFIPAGVDGVVTIGACDEGGTRTAESNFGDCVDVYAVTASTSLAAGLASGWIASHRNDDGTFRDISDAVDNKAFFTFANANASSGASGADNLEGVEGAAVAYTTETTEVRSVDMAGNVVSRVNSPVPGTSISFKNDGRLPITQAAIKDGSLVLTASSAVGGGLRTFYEVSGESYETGIWLNNPKVDKTINNPFSLKWVKCAKDSDGNELDFVLKAKSVSIKQTYDTSGIDCHIELVRNFGSYPGLYAYTDGHNRRVGVKMDFVAYFVKTGTSSRVNGTLTFAMADLDQPDKANYSWTFHSQASDAIYTEGFQLTKGFKNKVYLQQTIPQSSTQTWYGASLIDTSARSSGWIYGTANDDYTNQYRSGAVAVANITGSSSSDRYFEFQWTGSRCGTQIFNQYDPIRIYDKSDGTTTGTTDQGIISKNVDNSGYNDGAWHRRQNTSYRTTRMGFKGNARYKFTAKPGYRVTKVKVKGLSTTAYNQTITNAGTINEGISFCYPANATKGQFPTFQDYQIIVTTAKVADVSATLKVTKALSGYPSNAPDASKQFTFKLAAVSKGSTNAQKETVKAPLPDTKTQSRTGAGAVSFDAISYTFTGDPADYPITYKYTITESKGKSARVAYDTTARNITVTVNYSASNGKMSVSVSGNNPTVTNTYTGTCGVTAEKTDTSGTPLAGAVFSVYKTTQTQYADIVALTPVATMESSSNGIAQLAATTLPADGSAYKVIETKAPDGYNINTSWVGSFTAAKTSSSVDDKLIYDVGTCSDVQKTCGVKVTKKNSSDEVVQGAVFSVYQTTQTQYADIVALTPVATMTTDASGIAQLANTRFLADDLPYKIIETSVPQGYQLNTSWVGSFTASKTADDKKIHDVGTCTDVFKTCGVKVLKTDGASTLLEGAVFAVYKVPANTDLANITKAQLDAMASGDGVATGTKKKICEITSGANGLAQTSDTEFDTDGSKYALVELKAPYGYNLNETFIYGFEAAASTNDKAIIDAGTCTDVQKTCGVTATKTDASGAPLSGVTFGVYKTIALDYPSISALIPTATMTTGATGVAQLANTSFPADGSVYKVIELSGPSGYRINTSWIGSFAASGTSADKTVYDVGRCIDVFKTCGIKVLKEDAGTGNGVAGAVFSVIKLTNAQRTTLNGLGTAAEKYAYADSLRTSSTLTITSAADGTAQTSASSFNTDGTSYIVIETAVPNGYELNTEWYYIFTASTSTPDQTIIDGTGSACRNVPYGGLKVRKVSSTSASVGLPNAQFYIYDVTSLSVADRKNRSVILGLGGAYQKGVLITNGSGWGSTSNFALPVCDTAGNSKYYAVVETAPAPGFNLNSTWVGQAVLTGGVIATCATVTPGSVAGNALLAEYCADSPKTGTVSFQIQKELEGGTIEAGQFLFELEDPEGNIVTATNAADGTVTFPEITYAASDCGYEYDYVIRELPAAQQPDGADPQITYDSTPWQVSSRIYRRATSSGNQLVSVGVTTAYIEDEDSTDENPLHVLNPSLSSPYTGTLHINYHGNGDVYDNLAEEYISESQLLGGHTYDYPYANGGIQSSGLADYDNGGDWELEQSGYRPTGWWIVDSPDGTMRVHEEEFFHDYAELAACCGHGADVAAGRDTTIDLYAEWVEIETPFKSQHFTVSNQYPEGSRDAGTITNVYQPRCGTSVKKTDAATGEAIEGAVFEITADPGDSNAVIYDTDNISTLNRLEITTDATGFAYSHPKALISGRTYRVREISVPAGYALDDGSYHSFMAGLGTEVNNAFQGAEAQLDLSSNPIEASGKHNVIVAGAEEGALDKDRIVGADRYLSVLQYDSLAEANSAKDELADSGIAASVDGTAVEDEPVAKDVGGVLEPSCYEPGTVPDEEWIDIVLLDSGVEKGSPNVAEHVSFVAGDDLPYDEDGHGTRMLEHIRNIAPDATLSSVKVLGADGKGSMTSVCAGLEYAISLHPMIICMPIAAQSEESKLVVAALVDRAEEEGVTVVGAAGNDGADACAYVPGGIDSALIIGACDAYGTPLSLSNTGETVDGYIQASTTSEAAAKVTGYMAKLGCENDVWSPLLYFHQLVSDGIVKSSSSPADRHENTADAEPGTFKGAATVTVTFQGRGGTTSAGATSYTQTFTSGTAKNLADNKFTTLPTIRGGGWAFYGWAKTTKEAYDWEDIKRSYTDGQSATFTANTTLYAMYRRSHATYTGTSSTSLGTVYEFFVNASVAKSVALGYTARHTYSGTSNITRTTLSGWTFEDWICVNSANYNTIAAEESYNGESTYKYFPGNMGCATLIQAGKNNSTTSDSSALYGNNAAGGRHFRSTYSRNDNWYYAPGENYGADNMFQHTSPSLYYHNNRTTTVGNTWDGGFKCIGYRDDTTAAAQEMTFAEAQASSSVNIYAVGSRAVKLSFNTNGASSATPSTQTQTQYQNAYTASSTLSQVSFTLPAAPTKTGYTFAGWMIGSNTYQANATYTWKPAVSVSSTTATATAQWTPNIYTITLDNQGATSAGTSSIYEKYNTGYYTNSTCTTQMTTSANAITKPTRTGYTFGGYYTETDGGGTQYINANGYLTSNASTTNFTAAGTLYAKWTANTYTISLNNQSATSAGTTAIYEKYDAGYYRNSACTTQMTTSTNPITKPTRTGYTFGGYYTATNGGGIQYIDADGYLTSNVLTTKTLTITKTFAECSHEQYSDPIEIYYCLGEGEEDCGCGDRQHAVVCLDCGAVKVISVEEVCTECGETLEDWEDYVGIWKPADFYHYLSDYDYYQNAQATYAVTSYFFTGAATLYAKWTANTYELTLNDQNADFPGTSMIYEKYAGGYYLDANCINQMTSSTNPIIPPAKAGYTFGGYYTATGGSGTRCIDESGQLIANMPSTAFSNNTSLYAKWTANTYNIVYSGMGDATHGASHPDSATYGTAIQISNPTHNLGKAFLGWNITGMDDTLHVIGPDTTNEESASLVTETTFNNLRATSGTVTFKAIWLGDFWEDGKTYIARSYTDTPYVGITLTKKDAISDAVLPNTQFTITGAETGAYLFDANGTQVQSLTITTGNDGTASTTEHALVHGKTYSIVETLSPAWYENDNATPRTFIATKTAGSQFHNIGVFTDRHIDRVGVRLTKADAVTGQAVEGAVFEIIGNANTGSYLYGTDDSTVASIRLTTDGAGIAESHAKALLAGKTYKIREVSAPTGYENDNAGWVEFVAGATGSSGGSAASVDGTIFELPPFTDTPHTKATFIKRDADSGAALAGASFTITGAEQGAYLFDSTGNTVQSLTVTSGEDGTASTSPYALIYGKTYSVSETHAPNWYSIDDTLPRTFTAGYSTDPTTFTFTDTHIVRVGVDVSKTDVVTGEPVEGAVFEIIGGSQDSLLYNEQDNIVSSITFETGPAGTAITYGKALLAGKTYKIREVSAPIGYANDNAGWHEFVAGRPANLATPASADTSLYWDVSDGVLHLANFADDQHQTDGSAALSAATASDIPWHDDAALITAVSIDGMISPQSTAFWFADCRITRCDLAGLDTSHTTNMTGMFYGCTALSIVDASGLDVSAVTNMASMFASCSSLTTIYAYEDWNEGEPQSTNMFSGCTALVGGNGTAYEASSTSAAFAHPDVSGSSGYFTSKDAADGGISSLGVFRDSPLVAAKLLKADSATNAPLGGASFQIKGISDGATLYAADGSIVTGTTPVLSITSDAMGVAETHGQALVYGQTYAIREVRAPEGYAIDSTEWVEFVAGSAAEGEDILESPYIAAYAVAAQLGSDNSATRRFTLLSDAIAYANATAASWQLGNAELFTQQNYASNTVSGEFAGEPATISIGAIEKQGMIHDLGTIGDTAASTTLTIEVSKRYLEQTGESSYEPLSIASGEFSFELYADEQCTAPVMVDADGYIVANGGAALTATTGASPDGEASAEFPAISFGLSDVGEHVYYVKEKEGSTRGVAYDTQPRPVTVSVFTSYANGSTSLAAKIADVAGIDLGASTYSVTVGYSGNAGLPAPTETTTLEVLANGQGTLAVAWPKAALASAGIEPLEISDIIVGGVQYAPVVSSDAVSFAIPVNGLDIPIGFILEMDDNQTVYSGTLTVSCENYSGDIVDTPSFENIRHPVFDVRAYKESASTHSPLPNAKFAIYEVTAGLGSASSPAIPAVFTNAARFASAFARTSTATRDCLTADNAALASAGLSYVADMTTGADGFAITENGYLESGKAYAIVEIEAPAGYLLQNAPYVYLIDDCATDGSYSHTGVGAEAVNRDANGSALTQAYTQAWQGWKVAVGSDAATWSDFTFSNQMSSTPLGGLSVRKVDSDTQQTLEGATFAAYGETEFATAYSTWKTDNPTAPDSSFVNELMRSGVPEEDIPAGEYYIEPAAFLRNTGNGNYATSERALAYNEDYRVIEVSPPDGYDAPAYDFDAATQTPYTGSWTATVATQDAVTAIAKSGDNMVFANEKSPDRPKTADAHIQVHKSLLYANGDDCALQNGQFTFDLLDDNGDVLATSENDAEGKIGFDLSYSSTVAGDIGTHTYSVRENIPSAAVAQLADGTTTTWGDADAETKADLSLEWRSGRIRYDAAVHELTVDVVESEEGDRLGASISYGNGEEGDSGSIWFSNQYWDTVSPYRAPGSLVVSKIDEETSAPLNGAVFQAVGTNGEGTYYAMSAFADLSSEVGIVGDGYAVWYDELPEGTYFVSEVEAPEIDDVRYGLNREWSITVTVLSGEFADETNNPCEDRVGVLTVDLPLAGGPGTAMLLPLVGAAIIITCLILRRKGKQEDVRSKLR